MPAVNNRRAEGYGMTEIKWTPDIPFLEQASIDARDFAYHAAKKKLEELQKKDPRFNDPMTAYKYLQEEQMINTF